MYKSFIAKLHPCSSYSRSSSIDSTNDYTPLRGRYDQALTSYADSVLRNSRTRCDAASVNSSTQPLPSRIGIGVLLGVLSRQPKSPFVDFVQVTLQLGWLGKCPWSFNSIRDKSLGVLVREILVQYVCLNKSIQNALLKS